MLDRESLDQGVAGADVVVHAATKVPTDANPDEEDWERNDRVRREGDENLVAAAADAAGREGFDPVVLRGGYFYAHDAAHTRTLGERLLAGRLPVVVAWFLYDDGP